MTELTFQTRRQAALITDALDGNHPGCAGCGISVVNVATNPNRSVTFEGKLVLTEGVMFIEHPVLINPCCRGHSLKAKAESDPLIPFTPDDGKITIEGKKIIHVGDVTECLSKIIKIT
jgi:hypothetical protein